MTSHTVFKEKRLDKLIWIWNSNSPALLCNFISSLNSKTKDWTNRSIFFSYNRILSSLTWCNVFPKLNLINETKTDLSTVSDLDALAFKLELPVLGCIWRIYVLWFMDKLPSITYLTFFQNHYLSFVYRILLELLELTIMQI